MTDEKQELEHCERVADEYCQTACAHSGDLSGMLIRERAAARREGLAEGRELPRSVDRTEFESLRSKNEALAAEFLKLHSKHQRLVTAARKLCDSTSAMDGETFEAKYTVLAALADEPTFDQLNAQTFKDTIVAADARYLRLTTAARDLIKCYDCEPGHEEIERPIAGLRAALAVVPIVKGLSEAAALEAALASVNLPGEAIHT